jgi:hypothetical protein
MRCSGLLTIAILTMTMVGMTEGEVYSSVSDMVKVFQLERDLGNRTYFLNFRWRHATLFDLVFSVFRVHFTDMQP